MKKFYKLALVLMFLFLPIISFGCGELTFDDVPYEASSKPTAEVISSVDDSRNLMINYIGLKLKVKTVNTYSYMGIESVQEEKEVRDEVVTLLGKTSDNPSIAQIEKTRYINDVKTSYELKTYSHQAFLNGQEESYLYTFSQQFDEEGNVTNTVFNRTTYNNTIVSFLNIYNEAVPVINSDFVDYTQHKEFEGTNYYKLNADVYGLEKLKDNFTQDNSLYESPKLFVKNSLQDYVFSFGCEFGLKTTENYDYITYSTLNYQIENSLRKVYLKVSSKSILETYGDALEVKKPENVDEYTVHTFVNVMNQQNYITYKTSLEGNYTQVTVAEFGKDLSVEVKEVVAGLQDKKTNYFYKFNEGDSSYTCYKLNLIEQKYEESSFGLAILDFDFVGKSFEGRDTDDANKYHFGNPKAYTIEVAGGEIYKLIKGTDTNLFVVDYGTDVAKLGLTSSLEGFTPATNN